MRVDMPSEDYKDEEEATKKGRLPRRKIVLAAGSVHTFVSVNDVDYS